VKLGVQREGATREVLASIEASKLATVDGAKVDARLAGVVLTDLTADQKASGLYGVALSNVQRGSAAYGAGLRDGDVLAAIGQRRVPGVKGLPTTGTLGGRQLLLTIVRDDAVYYAVL
jgi:S1-C subfamily serine protease